MSESNSKQAVEDLDDALGVIHDEYEDQYPEWNRFSRDAQAHAESAGYSTDWYQPGRFMPVVRYRHDADTLRNVPEIGETEIDHLIAFARDGCPEASR